MSFKLQDLESQLPQDIVRKGLDYFAQQLVGNLAQQDDTWVADVYGTHTYTVEVKIRKEEVIHWFCDCPYDWGPVCKHVAAVLFAIRSEGAEAELEKMTAPAKRAVEPKQSQQSAKSKKAKIKAKPAGDPIEQIIAQLKGKELRELLLFLARREEEVRAYLLSKYADRLPQTSRKEFKQLVKSVIQAHRGGRYGFIDYQSSARLGDQLYQLVSEVSGESPTIYLCEEVIDQGASAVQEADDSSGSIGGAIDHAFNQLYELATPTSGVSPKAVKYLFKLGLTKHQVEKYDGLDWGGNFRQLAALAIRKQKQAEQFIQAMDDYIVKQGKEKYGKYWIEAAALLKLEILEAWYGADVARVYLLDHLHLSGFRRRELENALQEKRYDDLKRLAEEGIVLDTENRYPGLVNEWKKWLMRWAEITGDQTALIDLTEKMYLERGAMEYYRQLKQLIPKKEFSARVESYIKQFKESLQKYGGGFDSRIAAILEEEERWSELMTMIEAAPRLDLLDRYQQVLAKRFQKQYLECYDRGIRNEMDHSNNRKAYQNCCRYLNLMIKLGGREIVQQIVEDWRVAYPRRRAMLEELQQIKS